MADSRSKALQFAKDNRPRFLQELADLVAIPTVSADSNNKPDILRGADWLVAKLKKMGFDKIQVLDTGGHPMVFGEWMGAGPKAKTMLVYGHYDVQPADPIELWETEPYKTTVKGDYLHGRGTSDMKGQVIASMAAVEAAIHAGGMPVNVKFMLEGEEETGSPTLAQFIRKHADLFAGDFALNPDAGMLSPTQPTITYGLRGLVYFEVHITGPKMDLHSGFFGGAIRNPANELAKLIAGMHDADNRVTLPGFYDSVRPLDDEERAEFKRLPQNEEFYQSQSGVKELWGEKGYTALERVTGRPTLEVNGMLSGYTGEGPKTVLPAKAMAKISCRLVANQNPFEVEKQLNAYMKQNASPAVSWEVKLLSDAVASISERDSKEVQAMAKAQETVWGVKPIFRREGGTIPVVGDLQAVLHMESLNVGCGMGDDRMHSPNERMHLPSWEKEIDSFIHFFYNLAE
jgi:acetylornithine deacetylase/succinyl-diaminopimelate desuccinylase-like protein